MTHTSSPNRFRRWHVALAAALVAAFATTGLAGPRPQKVRKVGKLDRFLSARVADRTADSDLVDVIITARPGAKRRGLVGALRAQGALVRTDHSIVDAVTARVPAGMLRILTNDPDVAAISLDAPIGPAGLATNVSGNASGEPYSLRATLGLVQPATASVTRTFRQGANGYEGAIDAGVDQWLPASSFGQVTPLRLEGEGVHPAYPMIRFDGLFGNGTNQIPYGSRITSVSLRLTLDASQAGGALARMHRMLVPWTAASTWNSMTVSGAGLQRNNVEAMAAPDATTTIPGSAGTMTFSGAGLVTAMQSWVDGAPNNGWMIWQSSSNYTTVRTSEAPFSNRPLLTVTYQPPQNTTGVTGAGVTVAVID